MRTYAPAVHKCIHVPISATRRTVTRTHSPHAEIELKGFGRSVSQLLFYAYVAICARTKDQLLHTARG